MRRRCGIALLVLLVIPGSTAGQALEDYDYENLRFRGFGFDYGKIWPNKVKPTAAYSVRFDFGYLGPGVRIAPSLSFWSSELKRQELGRLAEQLRRLDADVTASQLGTIEWSDFSLSIDAHYVWTTPIRVLTYLGAGLGLHALNGRGEAIDDTFVEDLLDSISAAGVGIVGFELEVVRRFRVYAETRVTVLSDLSYPGVRMGGAIMLPLRGTGEWTPGERGAAQ